LAVLAAPILTRLYSPENFGMLAVFLSIVALFSVVAGFKYELAIPLPEDEVDAAALTVLSLILIVSVTLISAVSMYWWGGALASAMGAPLLADFLWLVPIAIFFAAMYNLFTYWAIRLKEFTVISRTKIRQQIMTMVTQVLLFKVGGMGLLIGSAAGMTIGVFTLAKKVLERECWNRQPSARIRYVLKRYRKFPFFSTWGGFLNTAGAQLPPLLFALAFGAFYAGLYALANRLIAMPMGLVGQAIGQVFLSDAASKYRSGELPDAMNDAHKMLIKCILPPTVILILFGPSIFALGFGEDWIVSGEIASWLSLWMMMAFTTSPLSSVFAVAEKQHLGMMMQAILLITRVGGIGVGVIYNNFMLSVILFSVFGVVGYLIYQVFSFQVLGISLSVPIRNYIPTFFVVTFCVLLSGISDVGSSILFFSASMVLSALHYFYMIRGFRND